MAMSSHPWKQSLEHQAKALQELMKTHRHSEVSLVKLEETVVLGCYTIRHLINRFLLPEARRHQAVPMTAFPRRFQGSVLPAEDPIKLRYDLDAGRPVHHDPIFLCHQVLQNCIFEPWIAPDHRLAGIYVTSDHQRKVALYGVGLEALHDLFHHLGADN